MDVAGHPFSVVSSWVFWMMEMIGELQRRTLFEGLTDNDVPITDIATSIEMRHPADAGEETNLPQRTPPLGDLKVVV